MEEKIKFSSEPFKVIKEEFQVLSSKSNKKYTIEKIKVTGMKDSWKCECAGFLYGGNCIHIKQIKEKSKIKL